MLLGGHSAAGGNIKGKKRAVTNAKEQNVKGCWSFYCLHVLQHVLVKLLPKAMPWFSDL